MYIVVPLQMRLLFTVLDSIILLDLFMGCCNFLHAAEINAVTSQQLRLVLYGCPVNEKVPTCKKILNTPRPAFNGKLFKQAAGIQSGISFKSSQHLLTWTRMDKKVFAD